MFTQFRSWSIKTKIMSILFASICMIALAVETVIVPLLQSHFMNERQNATKHVVEIAYGILAEHENMVQSGQERLDEAKQRAISLISTLRFHGQEYFWIHDLSRPIPKMIMHPTIPSLNGKVLDDPQFNKASGKRIQADSATVRLDNKNLFVTMNEVVDSAGEGFVSYAWPKPKTGGVTEELYPKISFVKKYDRWGWVIGSGVYVDDIGATVAHVRRLIHAAYVFFCLAAIFIYYLMARYISRPVGCLALLAGKIADGDYGAQLPVTAHDEIGLLSASLNRMSSRILQNTADLETANRDLQQELVERKRAEESLRISEEKFRTLVDNSFDVIFVLNGDGIFQFASPSWETHFGYPADSVLGQHFSQFVHPEDFPLCQSYLEKVMTAGAAATTPAYRVKHADTSWRLFIANGTIYHDNRGQTLYLGIGRDITDEKRLEEERLNFERQFLHAQKLESLGIMAGGIAHDFNNLLAVITGNIELSMNRLEQGSPSAIRMERAMLASRRAAELTRQMLAYTGKGVFELKPQNINQLIRQNSNLIRTSIPSTITLSTELFEPLPAVMADAGQLQQVIMNLITNAVEAIGSEPGSITLATSVREYDQNLLNRSRLDKKPLPGCFASFEITDSGCGMDEEMQQRIFEPFFTTKFTGRGLGMSSVMGIVKAHKGAILLYSEPGFGATFKVLLPVYATPAEDPRPLDAKAYDRQPHFSASETVLVVDDESPIREICSAYLAEIGVTVMTAAGGREALTIFAQHQDEISLVILDLSMPTMDGVAAFRELRRINPNVKVIISSGHAVESIADNFVDDKPAGFIQKPFQLLELQEKISDVLHSS